MLEHRSGSLGLSSEHPAVPRREAQALRTSASLARPRAATRQEQLFANLVVSTSRRRRRGGPAFWASLSAHLALVVAAILGPVFWPTRLPEHPVDYIRVLLYNPPPPPPLPLPKGNPLMPEKARSQEPPSPRPEQPATETPLPRKTLPSRDSTAPRIAPPPDFVLPDLGEEPWGSATGSELGVPEGMEGGVPGGQVGGIPGGVIGGVIGGRLGGILPVANCDRPPRPIRQTRPQYPEEAFVKKVEGTVLLEILINVDGRVAHAKVLRSIPLLDEAALATVREWLFEPALKDGRPVATLARAPIRFTIY
jgi:protein TonB